MTEQQKKFPEFYVTAPQPCPYLDGRLERKLFTHLTHDKPTELIDRLLTTGFRRSPNIAAPAKTFRRNSRRPARPIKFP